ncbi:hypothetical protein OESDEN_13711 [Oesophagostomum dentatum]|uniref:MULE transposase domain-containing protein n=1 Tax=Oesophagostomum dentatum TaxID=61180 RepID=A0A0B1SMH7_OESDE|nr:hypothetical protein OESDEN_13711 [Oesophagostomum dentatum]
MDSTTSTSYYVADAPPTDSAGQTAKPLWHKQNKRIKERAAEGMSIFLCTNADYSACIEEPELRDEMVASHYKRGPVSRRDTLKRAARVHNAEVAAMANMRHIPDHLKLLPDNSLFVHQMDPTLHVYYNRRTIEAAVRNGLHVLVADGVHSYQPRELGRQGQLYTVHGVCSNRVEVQLLYAVSSKKTEQVFPDATVQGCAFHLAQAWNRRRDKKGLLPFLEGARKSAEVEKWWNTIKGVVFLPRRLHREVRALTTPPVPVGHPAHAPCGDFLEYLRETWYEGMFADLWDKYGIEEVRTTNMAEAFHSQLNTLMNNDHPPLGRLLEVLRDLDSEAESALIAVQQNPSHEKYLRREDRERRQRIAEEMHSVQQKKYPYTARRMGLACITVATVEYLTRCNGTLERFFFTAHGSFSEYALLNREMLITREMKKTTQVKTEHTSKSEQ